MAAEWHHYQLTWRLDSPLHIGWRTIGTIARTRLWVPGRNLWGAIIDTIARLQQPTAEGIPPFKAVTRKIDQTIRFEAAFLASDPAHEIWAPVYGEQGLRFGTLLQRDLERRVLFASVSTAIEHGPGIADEGQLFEVEAISPRCLVGDHPRASIYLTGRIWVRATEHVRLDKNDIIIDQQSVRQWLAYMRIGGEQAKGFGRLSLQSLAGPGDARVHDDAPVVTINMGNPFPLLVKHDGGTGYRGEIEPIIGRNTKDGTRHGQQLTDASICWLPGSCCRERDITLMLHSELPGIATIVS